MIPINHFIDLPDVPEATLKAMLRNAHAMKRNKYNPPQILSGLSLAMERKRHRQIHRHRLRRRGHRRERERRQPAREILPCARRKGADGR